MSCYYSFAVCRIQGLNYLLPLIVLPYLLRVLRPTGYGTIVTAQALMGYAMVVPE